jgi:hypothetical protein
VNQQEGLKEQICVLNFKKEKLTTAFTMNPKVITLFATFVGLVSITNAQLGSLAILGLSSGTAALTSGTLTAFLTPAGAVAVGIGIIGAGIVKKAIAANLAGLYTQDFRNFGRPHESYAAPVESYGAPEPSYGAPSSGYGAPSSGYGAPSSGYGAPKLRARGRRDTGEETAAALDQIDAYFYTIANIDYDDCGKRLVCEVEALPAELRSEEEVLIAGLFGENNVIDPASAKAEYDLAAYLGASTKSKIACARRYHKCPMDRKTIGQAIKKQEAANLAAQQKE